MLKKFFIISGILGVFFLCFRGLMQSSYNGRTVIQFASWGSKSEIDILKPLLAEFELENPDIKVDFMHIISRRIIFKKFIFYLLQTRHLT